MVHIASPWLLQMVLRLSVPVLVVQCTTALSLFTDPLPTLPIIAGEIKLRRSMHRI